VDERSRTAPVGAAEDGDGGLRLVGVPAGAACRVFDAAGLLVYEHDGGPADVIPLGPGQYVLELSGAPGSGVHPFVVRRGERTDVDVTPGPAAGAVH
jgi:hypothetical protein